MDRHDISEEVTAGIVAQMHMQDLKVEHKFNCRGLTYWFDEKRKTAFCLVEAPNEKNIQEMHNYAHGEVPHVIIEVDANIVESFLGRIEDPTKEKDTDLNIINDPALRIIMVLRLKNLALIRNEQKESNASFEDYNESIVEIFNSLNGRIVKQDKAGFIISFESVSNAVMGALKVQSKLRGLVNENDNTYINLKIGLSAGLPVTESKTIFEDTIKLAERLCSVANNIIVLSSEVKDLYMNENLNTIINKSEVLALTTSEEAFINHLMDFIEKEWENTDLKVADFNKPLGVSKSQLYRKMILMMGVSPNNFLREYRLNRAWELINKKTLNISEIAYNTGFSSLSYFSKCFLKHYGILPSDYQQTVE